MSEDEKEPYLHKYQAREQLLKLSESQYFKQQSENAIQMIKCAFGIIYYRIGLNLMECEQAKEA